MITLFTHECSYMYLENESFQKFQNYSTEQLCSSGRLAECEMGIKVSVASPTSAVPPSPFFLPVRIRHLRSLLWLSFARRLA